MYSRFVSTIAFVSFFAACGEGGGVPRLPMAQGTAFPLIPPADNRESIGDRLGVALALTWGTGSVETAKRGAELDRLRATGIRRVRIDFSWHRLEISRGVWDFSGLDAVVADAARVGVKVLGLLAYGNPIYAPNGRAGLESSVGDDLASWIFAAVGDPAPFARFVSTVVARYKDRGVTDYEIWNEPNVGWRFWRPAADVATYAALVRAAAAAGRAACATCRFAIGGVAMAQPIPHFDLFPTGVSFLAELFARIPEPRRIVDAVAFHPYQYPKDPPEAETAPFPSRVQGSLATQIDNVAAVSGVARNGLALWSTENGWPTNPRVPTEDAEIARLLGVSEVVVGAARHLLGEAKFARLVETFRGVSEEDQTNFTIRAALIALSRGIARYDIYTLDDGAVDATVNQEAAFGLFRGDGSEKPVVAMLGNLLGRYGRFRFAGDLSGAFGLDVADHREWALAFREDERVAIAFWRWSDGRRTIRLPAMPGPAKVRDSVGALLESAEAGGVIDLTLGPDVSWVEIDLGR